MQLFWPTLYMQMMLLNGLVTDHFKSKNINTSLLQRVTTRDSRPQSTHSSCDFEEKSTLSVLQLPEWLTHGRVSQNNYVTTITSVSASASRALISQFLLGFLNLDKSGACLYDLHNIKSTTNETTVVDSKHSTSAMLIWIDAWSFAEMIRLLAELKHDTKQLHTVAQCSIVHINISINSSSVTDTVRTHYELFTLYSSLPGWLGSWVVSVLDSGAEGPGFKSQPRRCRVTVLGKLFTPIVSLFTKQQNW